MKKLATLILLSLVSNVLGVTMTNFVTDGFGNPQPVRVIITPFFPSTVFGGTNVLGPSTAVNAPAGSWSQSLLGGFYFVQQGLQQPKVVVYALPGDTQTNSFAYFAQQATNPLPSFYVIGTTGGTNVFIAAGVNVIVTTNLYTGAVLYTIASTGGGGGGSSIAVATNGVNFSFPATNVDFWSSSTVLVYATNRNGHADITLVLKDPLFVTELDILRAYATNLFTFITNASGLGTDADGRLILGSGGSGNYIANMNGNGTNVTINYAFMATNNFDGSRFFIDTTNHAWGFIQTNGNRFTYTNGIAYTSNMTVLGLLSNVFFSTVGVWTNNGTGNFGVSTALPESWISGLTADLAAKAPTTRALTLNGTANHITSSAGSQDLSADRTWTFDLANPTIVAWPISASNYTNTSLTGNALIAADANKGQKSVLLSGLTYDGTTLTAPGGTGIATNNGTGTNNVLTGPIIAGSGGSADSLEIVYTSRTNFFFGTNGDLLLNGGNVAKATRMAFGISNNLYYVANVLDFGLSTNGDNTAATQAAIDSLTNLVFGSSTGSGGLVVFPNGTWNVTGPVYLRQGIKLACQAPVGGSGGNGTVWYMGSSAGPALYLADNGKCEVEGLTIQGNGRNLGTGISSYTNTATPSQNWKIQHCNFISVSNGISLNFTWNGKIEDCDSVNTTHGIYASNQVNAIVVSGGHWAGSYFGFKILGLDYWWDVTTTFEQISNAVFMAGGVPGAPRGITLRLYGENDTNVVVANGVASLQVLGGQMNNCMGTNIVLVGCDHPQIIGTHFNDNLPSIDVDSTTVGLTYIPGMVSQGAAHSLRATTRWGYNGTNFFVINGSDIFIWSNGVAYNSAGISATSYTNRAAEFQTAGVMTNDAQGGFHSTPVLPGTLMSTAPTNDLNTLAKTYTNETTLRAYVTNLDQNILTPATATNTMPLYGGFWRLVVSGPAAITNLTGVTAGVYVYATCVFSNSLATTITNRMLVNAIASGYDATNSVAALGLNGFVVGAGKQVRLLVDAEGINQTNWMLIRQ